MSAVLEDPEEGWVTPFDGDDARTHSAYHAPHRGEVVRLLDAVQPAPFARVAHDAFRTFVLDDAFSCLGAKSSLRRGLYRFGAYARLDDGAVSAGLARDLYAFVGERRGFDSDFSSFAAFFREPITDGEAGFERALWGQLQRLHDLDAAVHPWDTRVSADPADPRFSFSFAGTAFFVVGMHPHASRSARRFAWPALIFNAHEQFEHLRADGRFAGLQRQIRVREHRLDGALNPNLSEYGRESEARQYSGRATGEDWACPLRVRR